MSFRHTTALLALLGPLTALSCSDPGRSDSNLLDELERLWTPSGAEPGMDSAAAPVPESCRNVAAQRQVRVGEASGEASCEFVASTSLFSCRLALGASGELFTSEYASLSDFIEAGRARGKVTSLREVRKMGRRETTIRHEYDELGRLIARHEARPEGDVVFTYSDHDELGRPRAAQPTALTLEQWGCSVAPLTIEYGEQRVRYQYRPAAACRESEYSIVERFDSSGNLLRTERFSPAGVETLFEADAPTATQLVCD